MKSEEKYLNGRIDTTIEFLEGRNLTLESVKENVLHLIKVFQGNYTNLFPLDINSNHIDQIVTLSKLFSSIENLEGFERHIEIYNKLEFDSHIYTARVARYLKSLNYDVVLEPIMETDEGPHPDILINRGDENCYVECKTSEISKFYDRDLKKQIADFVYSTVHTCDQINLKFKSKINLEDFKKLFDTKVVQDIYQSKIKAASNREITWELTNDIEITIIFQGPIIGAESDFLEMEIGGMLVNSTNHTKSIGFQFLKGGRSIGVYEVVNFRNKLKKKRLKSSNQLVDHFPNLVFIKDTNVLGDAELNQSYIEKTWLTKENSLCSGIVFYDEFSSVDTELNNSFRFLPNKFASIKFEINDGSQQEL